MKAFLFTCTVLLGVTGTGMRVDAQNYPWCAYYTVGDEARNCGFVTYEQCMANVRGIGGYCARNTQYVPSVVMPGPRTRAQRRPWYSGMG
jgi:hypothetical protein